MLNGKLNGKSIGSGTAVWQLHEQMKGGQITMHDFLSAKAGHLRAAGTCNTMSAAWRHAKTLLLMKNCEPYRVGYAIGNEFSDHVTERQNYLYLTHPKLKKRMGSSPHLKSVSWQFYYIKNGYDLFFKPWRQ